MLIHTITINGLEASRANNMHDYITAQNAILATLTNLRTRFDFKINTYTYGDFTDRCLSITTDPIEEDK